MDNRRFWIVTVQLNHAQSGLAEGIVQACHGKIAPLRRMKPGDGVVLYSPKTAYPTGEPLQKFTAIGEIEKGEPYVFDMGGGFVPHRRRVLWSKASPTPIRPLLDSLDLTRGKTNWGMVFRYGLSELGADDFAKIGQAMGADIYKSA
jgi:hypothetical protein